MPAITLDQAFQLAIGHYHAGRWAEAESLYRQILARLPDNPLIMHQLGIVLAPTGRREEATDLLRRVVTMRPENAEAHSDLGTVLYEQRRLAEAAAALSRAIALKPGLALAHGNLANVYRDMGRLDDAIAEYRRAIEIKPDYAAAYSNLGNAFCDKRQFDNAIAAYRRAIELDPRYPSPFNNLGVALERTGRSAEAVPHFKRALELAPNFAEALSNLGRSLESLGRVDEAIALHERAIQLKPDSAEFLCNLGNAFLTKKQPDRALAILRKAAQLQPNMAAVHNNLGIALSDMGNLDDAIAAYRHSLALDPNYPDAMSNLAHALIDHGDRTESEPLLRRAVELSPDFADAHWNLAILLLLQGNFAQGLSEYEWRWKVRGMLARSPCPAVPPWDGRDLTGQTILLHAEQGIGDVIQFIRYVPLVAARGAKIILRCPSELHRLFSQFADIQQIIDPAQPLPNFNVHCPLLSLPFAFKTDLQSIPAAVPYLKADPSLSQKWKEKLSSISAARKIGLAWAGAAIHINNRNRSTTLSSFAPLSQAKDAAFISLQKGPAANQPPPPGLPFFDFTSELSDFADTAALIDNLDLILTVDTSIAHLAGAMGKPVWVLLPCNPDWRWMYDRPDSPWYPTMTLFRQSKPNDWAAVLAEILRRLNA